MEALPFPLLHGLIHRSEWKVSEVQVYALDKILLTPRRHTHLCSGYLSKPRRSPRPNLTICLEAFYHHLPLTLVLPEILEGPLLLGIIRRLGYTFCAFYAFCAIGSA
jgi:hypothetical protein